MSDALNHASIVDACRLSRSRVVVVPHRETAAVASALAERSEPDALVVTDAVFSVDGDLARLADLHAAAHAHGALLLVDEAHSLGVVGDSGRGAVHAAGLAGRPRVVITATLSKALGAQGGAVLGDPEVVAHLIDAARPFIFDTGLAPAAVGAAYEALRVLAAEPDRAIRARAHAAALSDAARSLGLRSPERGRRRGPDRVARGGGRRRRPIRAAMGVLRGLLPPALGAGRRLAAAAHRPGRPDGR